MQLSVKILISTLVIYHLSMRSIFFLYFFIKSVSSQTLWERLKSTCPQSSFNGQDQKKKSDLVKPNKYYQKDEIVIVCSLLKAAQCRGVLLLNTPLHWTVFSKVFFSSYYYNNQSASRIFLAGRCIGLDNPFHLTAVSEDRIDIRETTTIQTKNLFEFIYVVENFAGSWRQVNIFNMYVMLL